MSIFRRTPTSASTASTASTAVLDEPAGPDLSGEWTIDPGHSRLGFSARHAMVTTVRGSFGGFEGTARIDGAVPASSHVALSIAAASVETGSADRDGHLRSPDFFDVATYPEITFTSTAVERDGEEWRITGDLVIKGVSRPVTIPFQATGTATDPFGNQRAGFEGRTTVNRKDWDLTWNAALETGGVLVSDKITLEFDVSAIKSL